MHVTLAVYVLPRAHLVAFRFHEVFGKVPLLTHLIYPHHFLVAWMGGDGAVAGPSALRTCKAGALSGKAACQSFMTFMAVLFTVKSFPQFTLT